MPFRCFSFTGFGFICLPPDTDYFKLLQTQFPLHLHIPQLTFPSEGPYALLDFVSRLSGSTIPHFIFHDLSLASQYSNSYPLSTEDRPILSGDFQFVSVTEQFLRHFFGLADFRPTSLTYENSPLPDSMRLVLNPWSDHDVGIEGCSSLNDGLLSLPAKEDQLTGTVLDGVLGHGTSSDDAPGWSDLSHTRSQGLIQV